MSRFSRLVVVALLLCTFGLLTAPAFASPDDVRTSPTIARWQVLVEQVLSWISIVPAGPALVESKNDDPPLPDDPNKPPVDPSEATYVVDPAG